MPPVTHRLLVTLGLLCGAAFAFRTVPAGDKVKPADVHGDPLPDGAVHRIGSIRLRHNGEIGLLAFAPDGKSLLSLGGDQTFRRWDVATGKELARFEKKGLTIFFTQQMMNRMGRFPGGAPMMMAGGGRMIVEQYFGEGAPSPAAHSADGKILATIDTRNAVLLLDTTTGKLIRKVDLKESQGHALALSSDGKLLAVTESNGEDNNVRLWDLPADKELPNLKLGKQRLASRLLFSHDAKMLAAITSGQIRLWDVTTGKRARLYEGHENLVTGIAFSSDGKYLASSGADGSVRLWETGSEEEVKKFTAMDQNFTTVALSPNGKYVLAGSGDQRIYRWSLAGDETKILEGHGLPAAVLAVAPDSATLASADTAGAIRLWDLESGKEKDTVKQPDRLHGFGVGDGGKSLALWTATGKIRHVDLLSDTERDSLQLPTDEGMLVEVSPDGRLACLLRGGEEESCRIWDGVKGQELHKLAAHPGGTSAVSFSPDSKLLVTSGADSTVRVWDALTGKEILHIANISGTGVTFSPDGKLLAIQCDEDVCLFEMATGKERCRLRAPNSGNSAMCFSPDSKLLTTNSGDEVIRLWDVVQGKLLRGLIGHQAAVLTVAFAPRGDVLASGSRDGTVRLWKASSGEELRCFEGHQGEVQHLAFADDGKFIVSAASDNCVLVWDAASRPAIRAGNPVVKKMDGAWADLASDDGAVAFKAMGDLIAKPKESVAFMATKLQPVPVIDPAILRRLVDDLDHKNFNTRQHAMRELEKLEGQARVALDKALAKPPSAEAQARIKKLLDRLSAPLSLPEDLRAVRAVEVLERIGTPEARDLLGRLARGAPGARLTREAAASLGRLQ
jgi:WD40 repeat protein